MSSTFRVRRALIAPVAASLALLAAVPAHAVKDRRCWDTTRPRASVMFRNVSLSVGAGRIWAVRYG